MAGELYFVGLGLYDEKDMTIRSLELLKGCDAVFAEFYTSRLNGTTVGKIEDAIGKKIRVLSRDEVEGEKLILDSARDGRTALIVAGDPMVATTHVSLRLHAIRRGIRTAIVHNASIISAAASALGLQHYKFGKTVSIPFRAPNYRPTSAYDIMCENLKVGAHTLVLLDLKPEEERYMSANEGLKMLLEMESEKRAGSLTDNALVCVIGGLGSSSPVLRAGPISELLSEDFGPVPHSIIVPGKLHFMEVEALEDIAGMSAPSASRRA